MNVTIEWTLEQAVAADREALAQDPSRPQSDPTLPLSQWAALQEMGCLRAAHEQGDRRAVLEALHLCAVHSLPLPGWVAQAYANAYMMVRLGEARSWDDVFGPAIPKGAHLSRVKKERKALAVYWEVYRRHAENEPIDDLLFESVGKPLGLGKTSTSDLYYSAKRRLETPLFPAVKAGTESQKQDQDQERT